MARPPGARLQMADQDQPQLEEAAQRDEQESLARIERGGIPLGAERRLRELGESGGSFTSDLSVADYALCHQLRMRPVSQVMGSSIYQVGYQATPWPGMGQGGGMMFELDTLSEAWNDVRTRALGRLAQEAALVGGDAVLGVERRVGRYDFAENSIEYAFVGTAVRHEHKSAGSREAPVMTELSVADYAKLAQAQVEPLGIVAWSSVFFVGASYTTQMLGTSMGFTRNQELPEFTQGIYGAREAVVARMTAQAARLRASGVIGVRIDHGIQPISLGGGRYERGGLMVNFHAIGTAIREPAGVVPPAPKMIVDLTT
jgi:uncharacterized protein YbjQ (UPF0145 family)